MHSVCLYCGSRHGARPAYREAARAFGRAIGGSGLRLVYGGGDVGLMGIAAREAMAAGGQVTGFIPRHIIDREIATGDVTNLVVTETMHERKKLMLYNADAIVALPGGPGTLDELVEVLTWRQLGLHGKPAILVDVQRYWQPFLALIEHIVAEGFVEPDFRDYFCVVNDPEAAVARLLDSFR
jgi:hypothetical protein